MQHEINGVNESKLDKHIMEIYESADRINKIFVKISALVNDTSNYFVCETADSFRKKFENVKSNFSIVNSNVLEYANDLVKVKNNYNKRKDIIINDLNSNNLTDIH